jgi:cell wall-active antibiotic response 4TMS protein YvqF/B-box zinc finger protein
MDCSIHPDRSAVAFCRECGVPMCEECQRPALGSIFCRRHVPAAPSASATPPATSPASPYTAPRDYAECYDAHPVLAFILGFIPGVGAIYNGQYAKGLIHVVVFGILVTLMHGPKGPLGPFIGLMIAGWIFYMAFEAYHTARKRRYGVAVEEFSSLIEPRSAHSRFPAGAILLIALGFILLLDTTGIVPMYEIERYWPVGLIVLGVYLLFARVSAASHDAGNADRGADGAWSRR